MKKRFLVKLLCVLIVCVTVMPLFSGCTDGDLDKVVMEYKDGEGKVTSKLDVAFLNLWLAEVNSNGYEQFAAQLDNGWDTVIDEKQKLTLSEVVKTSAVDGAKNMLAGEFLYDNVYDIGFTDQQEAVVDEVINGIISSYGTKELLEEALEKSSTNLDALRRYIVIEFKCKLLYYNLFEAEGAPMMPADEDYREYFAKNYRIADTIYIDTRGYAKEDGTVAYLNDEQLKEKEMLANDIYNQVKADPSTYELLQKQYNQDNYTTTYPFGYFVTADGTFPEKFEKAVLSMGDGEIRLVKTDEGYHIIRKNPMDDGLYASNGDFKSMLKQELCLKGYADLVNPVVDGVEVDEDNLKLVDPAVIPGLSFSQFLE